MAELDTKTIERNLNLVLEKMATTAQAAGRAPNAVRLVVVTKGHTLGTIEAVVQAGAQHLGENYAEEAVEKIVGCSDPSQVQWHMIGHIQSRKTRLVSEYFDYVHSVDSLKIANRLDRFAGEQGRRLPILLECNVSAETTKYGFSAWHEADWEQLLPGFEEILALPNLNVQGLMTMAPYFPDPELARPFYRELRKLRDFLRKRLPQTDWQELSMGMSADYPIAIQEGATQVRVGTAIVGDRSYT